MLARSGFVASDQSRHTPCVIGAERLKPLHDSAAVVFRLVLADFPFAFERGECQFDADDGGEHLLDVIGLEFHIGNFDNIPPRSRNQTIFFRYLSRLLCLPFLEYIRQFQLGQIAAWL